jgi:hypothetical protein
VLAQGVLLVAESYGVHVEVSQWRYEPLLFCCVRCVGAVVVVVVVVVGVCAVCPCRGTMRGSGISIDSCSASEYSGIMSSMGACFAVCACVCLVYVCLDHVLLTCC